MKTLIAATGLIASLALSVTTAKADQYRFTFSTGAPNMSVTGTFTADSIAASVITNLTGTIGGNPISLLSPGATDSSYGQKNNDNVFYPGQNGQGEALTTSGAIPMGYLDKGGIGFTAGGSNYSLFFSGGARDNPVYNILLQGQSAGSGNVGVAPGGSFSVTNLSTVSSAPEPGIWTLMLGGVGMIGAMMRVAQARRREDELNSIATA